LFIYVNSAAIEREAVVTFVDFYLKNASALSAEVGYIPLPPDVYQGEMAKFNEFTKR